MDVKYLKKGSCANVPDFIGDGVIYEKDISLPLGLGNGGASLTFKKDGTFVIVGTFNGNSSTYPNNKWVYLKESCIIGVTLDPTMLAEIKKSPVSIDFDNSLHYNEHKQIIIKFTIAGILASEITVSQKKL
jgi:hypothetical protein